MTEVNSQKNLSRYGRGDFAPLPFHKKFPSSFVANQIQPGCSAQHLQFPSNLPEEHEATEKRLLLDHLIQRLTQSLK